MFAGLGDSLTTRGLAPRKLRPSQCHPSTAVPSSPRWAPRSARSPRGPFPRPRRSSLRLACACSRAGADRSFPRSSPGSSPREPSGVLIAREGFRGDRGLRALIARVRALTPAGSAPPLIAADQEGGTVHLSPSVPWTPSLTTLGQIDDASLTRRVASALGTHLRDLGVSFDLAPVLDVRTNGANMVVFGLVRPRPRPRRAARARVHRGPHRGGRALLREALPRARRHPRGQPRAAPAAPARRRAPRRRGAGALPRGGRTSRPR